MHRKIYALFLTFSILSIIQVQSQVTTATMTGTIYDENSEPLIGATIKAVHEPSGSIYGVATVNDGRYFLPNMRVGGPYTIEVSFVGYNTNKRENLHLSLGQKLNLDFKMAPDVQTLSEIVVTDAVDPVLNGERTGASTAVSREQIQTLPTISRSAADFTRLNPMSSEGGSFAGRNDQFNNYSLDGTIFNNPFGLDAATPGGQTDAQPVSLDAIDQINVAIAPYDVTQSGFTGAAINAVTKSGTNKFSGTVFTFFRNAGLTGGKVDGTEVNKGDLSQLQTGFSIGGPIVKNKAFFFANMEIERRSDLGSNFIPNRGSTGSNVARVLASDMEMVADLLDSRYGYQTGAIENFKHDANNIKGILKLDVNLSDNHKLTATYNFLDAFKDKPGHPSAIGRRGPDFQTLQFQNSGYRINNKIHSGIIELKSSFGNTMSNKFQFGASSFRDNRDAFSAPFPVLNIGKDGVRYIIAGHEPFSINNVLSQDVLQFNDNFNLYLGKHSYTFGFAFEKFNFGNSFNLTGYGTRVFFPDVDIADFPDLINSGALDTEVDEARATFQANNANDSWALAETRMGQFSLYAQDEIAASDKLTLTIGLRMDMPLYFNTPDLIQENIDRKGGLTSNGGTYSPEITYYDEEGSPVTFEHTELPKNTPLFNPRVGFNFDANGDRSLQIRGGTGLFSGRFPFVWIGNQVANPDFFFYNMTDPDFKFPQVWRTSLGVDKMVGDGWIATVDLLYTKDTQAALVKNFGLRLPTGTLGGVDNRPIYLDGDRAQDPFGEATNAYVFTNSNSGYSFNAAFQISKSWENNYIMLGYNFLAAEDVASIDAEISSDAYERNPANIAHTNRPELAPSLYGNKHRILGALTKRFNAESKYSTTVSIFMEYVSGTRYSYTYSGDLNNDGSPLNDLIYIPTDGEIDQMQFTGDAVSQRTAFKQYISQDEYLNERRGEYAEKYAAISPWYSHWDIKILQDIGINNDRKFQVSLDILNVGNLISSKWGVREFATQTGLAQPIGVLVTAGEPTYSFDASQTTTFFNDFSLLSRWQAQFGLRFIF